MQKAKCMWEPRGDHGLEGYQRDNIYDCEYRLKDKNGKPYWRVYPDAECSTYYETCSVRIFRKHFKLVGVFNCV